jgi:AcrR family transcriptional regulator
MLGSDSMTRLADPELPERRRRQILDAASYCFGARGFRHTTIEDICGEARISPGALYRYFASKTDIVTAIAFSDTDEPSSETIDAALDHLITRAVGDAGLTVELWAEAAHEPLLAQALAERHQRRCAWLGETIAREAPQADAAAVAGAVLAALDGMALRGMLNRSEIGIVGAQLKAMARALLRP